MYLEHLCKHLINAVYPKLKSIYLVSNGNMWTKEMWESVKAIHPYVYEYEISIDAATKETYENKVRLNGHWNTLMENLKYHSTLKFINKKFFICSTRP